MIPLYAVKCCSRSLPGARLCQEKRRGLWGSAQRGTLQNHERQVSVSGAVLCVCVCTCVYMCEGCFWACAYLCICGVLQGFFWCVFLVWFCVSDVVCVCLCVWLVLCVCVTPEEMLGVRQFPGLSPWGP